MDVPEADALRILGSLGFDQLDQMVDDVVVLQAVVLQAVDVDLVGAAPAAGEADVRHQRLAGAVDHAADDREAHGGVDMGQPLFQDADGLDDVEALPGAGGARDDRDAAVAQAQRLEYLEARLDLLDRVGRKRDPDRVADAGPEQVAETNGRLDGARGQAARLGDAKMDRRIGDLGQLLVGGGGSRTRSALPMLPGLMRRQAAPASAASMARL